MKSLIRAEELKTWFPIKEGFLQKVKGHVKAVDGVNLDIAPGEVYSLVGESGSGKSTLGYSLLGITPYTSGKVWLDEKEMVNKGSWNGLKKDFQIIYQNSYSSLNPRMTVLEILSSPMKYYGMNTSELEGRGEYLLKQVDLNPEMLKRFPHAFSGGQRQRINIARALGVEPKFIVCDEIVSALDVRVQARILELLQKLKEELNLGMLFISHDLAVVQKISDRIGVMYKGKKVEEGTVSQILKDPKEEYTKILLSSAPSFDLSKRKRKVREDFL